MPILPLWLVLGCLFIGLALGVLLIWIKLTDNGAR